MLWAPTGGRAYSWFVNSAAGTRPATDFGTSCTAGNNSKGSWAQVLSALARDVYFLRININSVADSGQAKDCLVDIGVDPAGGTSYTVLIPNLLASGASQLSPNLGFGVSYYFPLYIKAGSTVAARASTNNSTPGTARVWLIGYGGPRNRELARFGRRVVTFGITEASSRGSQFTPGTTSEGDWFDAGAITNRCWWWQFGFCVNDSGLTSVSYHADVAVGTSTQKHLVIENQMIATSTNEQVSVHGVPHGCVLETPASGYNAYMRLQCSGTADVNLGGAIYAVTMD